MTDAELKEKLVRLARANEVRTGRARVKRDLAAGRKTLAQALAEPCCASAKVLALILAQPAVGRSKGYRAMRDAGILESRRVDALTSRQRVKLIEASEDLRLRVGVPHLARSAA